MLKTSLLLWDKHLDHSTNDSSFGFSGNPWTNSANLEPDAKPRSIQDLDSYALGRWEALLHYLTEKAQQEDSVSKDTALTLEHAGLMQM